MLLYVLRCSFVFLKFVGFHGRSILFLFYAAVEHFINLFNDGTEFFLIFWQDTIQKSTTFLEWLWNLVRDSCHDCIQILMADGTLFIALHSV